MRAGYHLALVNMGSLHFGLPRILTSFRKTKVPSVALVPSFRIRLRNAVPRTRGKDLLSVYPTMGGWVHFTSACVVRELSVSKTLSSLYTHLFRFAGDASATQQHQRTEPCELPVG